MPFQSHHTGFLSIVTTLDRLLGLPSPVEDIPHPRSSRVSSKGKERMLNYASFLNGQFLPRPPLHNVSCFLLSFLGHNWLFVCGPGEANRETCSKGTGIFFTGIEPCFVLYPSPWKALPL